MVTVLAVGVCLAGMIGCQTAGPKRAAVVAEPVEPAAPGPAEVAAPKPGMMPRFIVPGEFSIGTPPGGYEWALHRVYQSEGVDARTYVCSQDPAGAIVVLGVIEQAIADDVQRQVWVEQRVVRTHDALTDAGVTELQGGLEQVPTPVPDQVTYRWIGQQDGRAVHMHYAIVFGRRTFVFDIMADSAAKADALADVIDTFVEMAEDEDAVRPAGVPM
jgi:hypothetical protein